MIRSPFLWLTALLALFASTAALLAQEAAPTEPVLALPRLEDSETFPADGLVDQRPAHWRIVWTDEPQTKALVLWDTAAEGRSHRVLFDTRSRAAEVPPSYAFDRAARGSGRYSGKELVLHWHAVALEGLQPDTTYYFVLESDGERSAEMHFRTAPAQPKPFALLSGGDARSDRSQRRAVNRLLAQLIDLRPEVLALAHGGDYVLWGTQLPLWDRWLRDQELVIGKGGRILPILPTRGNHEATGPLFDEVFGAPGGAGRNYFATELSPEVLLLTLNTEIAAGGDQARFLEAALEARRATRWQVAQYHRPLWPAVKQPATAAPHWLPLFDRLALDLALENDGHALKRTVPIKAGALDESGTVYVGEGGFGVQQRKPDTTRWYLQSPGYAHSRHHVWELRFDSAQLELVVWDLQAGKIFDRFALAPRRRGGR